MTIRRLLLAHSKKAKDCKRAIAIAFGLFAVLSAENLALSLSAVAQSEDATPQLRETQTNKVPTIQEQ